MAAMKIISLAILVSVCLAEPPVSKGGFSGYNYQAPSFSAPSTSYGAPGGSYSAPSSSYGAPSHSAPSSSYGAPSHSYNAPSSSYSSPSSSYGAPSHSSPSSSYGAPSHGAPSSSYHAPSSSYSSPSSSHNQGYPSSSYGAPSTGYDSHSHNEDHGEPKSYEFGYAVKDPHTGNDYGRKETSDGNTVQGEYRVQLPDGRTQIVTYHADWKTGFHADVRYEGEAKYPETSGYTGPKNQFGSHPSSQYGAPSAGHGNFNQGASHYSPSSSGNYHQSSEFAGSLTGFGSNQYDSYSSGYNQKSPSTNYGTPQFH